MFILVLQSSQWRREGWLICFVCLPGVSDCCVALPHDATVLFAVFDCGIFVHESLHVVCLSIMFS